MRLEGGQWVVWPWAVLRSAGFPAHDVIALDGGRAAGPAADAFAAAHARVISGRIEGLRRISAQLRQARGEQRVMLRSIRRRLRGTARADSAHPDERAVACAAAERATAYAVLVEAYRADIARAEAHLVSLLERDTFREAAVWQTGQAVLLAQRKLTATAIRGPERRSAAQFVAMLAQRYAVKNDTIGFFGPSAWARVSPDPIAMEIMLHPQQPPRQPVYFEGWALDALVEAFDALPGSRPWAAPRLPTGAWQSKQGEWFFPLRGATQLSPLERQILLLCDGVRSAREIADVVLRTTTVLQSHAEVFALLDRLVQNRVLVWRHELHPQLHPEYELRARLERVGDPALRAEGLAALQTLLAARERVQSAAGDASALAAALSALGDTFTALTRRSATRRPGQTYAGRNLVYQDCRRDCDVQVGARILARLGPPLTIVLDAVRWAAGELASRFRVHLRSCLQTLRATRPLEKIDAQLFFSYASATSEPQLQAIASSVESLFRQRWQSILEPGTREQPVVRRVADIRERACRAFPSPASTWSRARYFSPDVLIAAPNLHALNRGEWSAVLGEVHTTNTLLWSALVTQHSCPEELERVLASDATEVASIVTQTPRADWLARFNVSVVPPNAHAYQYTDDLPELPTGIPAPAAMFTPFDDGATVRMLARDHSLEFDAIELFGVPLCRISNRVVSQLLPDAPCLPRVTLDALTISRARWWLGVQDCHDSSPERSYARLRTWARRNAVPRHVFYKSPLEPKPCYLDLASSLYAELFRKAIGKLDPGQHMRIEEMLPHFDDLWLADASDHRYTSEFRFAVRHLNEV